MTNDKKLSELNPLCAACGKSGRSFSKNQLKRALMCEPARCSTCIESNFPIKTGKDKHGGDSNAIRTNAVETDAPSISNKRKREDDDLNSTSTSSSTSSSSPSSSSSSPSSSPSSSTSSSSTGVKQKSGEILTIKSPAAPHETASIPSSTLGINSEATSSKSVALNDEGVSAKGGTKRKAVARLAPLKSSPKSEEEQEEEDEAQGMDISLTALKQQVLGRPFREETSDMHHDVGEVDEELGGKNVADLRRDLGCPICHELLYQPASLLCGHSFCRECIRWWLGRTQPPSVASTDVLNNNPSDATSYGNCPTCRRSMQCDGPSLGVNTALRVCVATLFPDEWRTRAAAENSAKRKATAGESGGAHSRGYEAIESLHDAPWKKVLRGLAARRSTVLDANDQRMQLALALKGDELRVSNAAGRNGVIQLALCLLFMEEDEVSNDGGFPLVLHEEDDEVLMATEDRFQYSFVEARAKVGHTDSASMSDVPIGLGKLQQGVARFRIDLGTHTLRDAQVLCFHDKETGAELELKLPGRQPRLKDDENNRILRAKASSLGRDDEEYSDDDDGDHLDHFEEDGFVVPDGEEEDECEHEESAGGVQPIEDVVQPIEDVCSLCKVGGELLVCDGGSNMAGCGLAFHIACVGRDAVPDGDWVCQACANEIEDDIGVEGYEFPAGQDGWSSDPGTGGSDDNESDDDSPVKIARSQKNKAKARKILVDSESDED